MADSWQDAPLDSWEQAMPASGAALGSWDDWSQVDVSAIKIPGLDGDVTEDVKQVALDGDDEDEPTQGVVDLVAAESQPRNEDKVRGLQPLAQIKKTAANKAKQTKKPVQEKAREEMTPAQLKARQRELEENSDMAAAADTFGFEVEEKKEVKKEVAKPDMFDSLDRKGGKEAYGSLASKVSAKLLKFQDDANFMHLVTELAKNLSTAMSVEQISDFVAAMEVVKNAKRAAEKGGKKKKKGPAVKGKVGAGREDMVEDEYDGFL